LAHKVNTEAPGVLAEKASQLNIPMIHFSTDYVFDGLKNEPYLETDQANPQSVYGETKWKGEEGVRNHKKHIILRTSWVFSSHGDNFLKTILKLIQEKSSLNIVSDQKGTPTSVDALADATYNIVKTILNDINFKDFGTYHVALEGETSWYQYACFVTDEAIRLGLKTLMTSQEIKSISSDFYPTAAKRPMNSRLNTTKIKKTFVLKLPSWEEEVANVIKIALINT
jgi:dTDP-4-dehydrorhamnose reductase